MRRSPDTAAVARWHRAQIKSPFFRPKLPPPDIWLETKPNLLNYTLLSKKGHLMFKAQHWTSSVDAKAISEIWNYHSLTCWLTDWQGGVQWNAIAALNARYIWNGWNVWNIISTNFEGFQPPPPPLLAFVSIWPTPLWPFDCLGQQIIYYGKIDLTCQTHIWHF